MTTAQTLKLLRGSTSIDLTTAPYAIGRDFEIPQLARTSIIAEGSSANVYGGGVRTYVKYRDREWSFEIRVNAGSDAAVRSAARRVANFLQGINSAEKTYIEYRPNSDTPAPLWGVYGAPLRFEVIDGTATVWPEFAQYERRGTETFMTINVTIKPFAETSKMLTCTATGGISEDTIGRADGRSLGVIVPEATTNLSTNPTFGNSTWNNSWTAGANIIEVQNTEVTFLLPFTLSSARLTAKGATNNTYTQSLTLPASTHTISVIIKLPDSGTVSSTQMQISYNGSAQTTVFTSAGNGLWYAEASVTGTAGASDTGIVVKNGYTVYLLSMQVEAKAYRTPLCTGDLLGCAWSGTIHASTSTRTAGTCTLPTSKMLNRGQGCIRMIFKCGVGTAALSPLILWSTNTINFRAYWSGTGIIFEDGTNTASATVGYAVAGTTYVLHFVWGLGGLVTYLNGVSVGTASYTASSSGTLLYLGSSGAGASQINGAAQFAIFDQQLTATQVANDYANMSAAITNAEPIGSVPWFYTDDGDNILSLDTGKKPLGVVGGVPGSAPAITEMQGALSSNWSTIKSIALSNYACDAYIGLGTLLYDYSGTAAAGDYGGKHLTTTVNGSGILLSPANPVLSSFIANQINGMEFYIFTRLYGSAATSFLLYSAWSNSSSNILSLSRVITPAAGSAYRMFITDMSKVESDAQNFTGTPSNQVSFYMYGSKIASNVDISVDYIAIMPRPVLLITGGTVATTGFVVKGFSAYHSASGYISFPLNTIGDAIEFAPNKFNHFQCYFCPDGTVDPVTTYQATFSAIYITPRWALL